MENDSVEVKRSPDAPAGWYMISDPSREYAEDVFIQVAGPGCYFVGLPGMRRSGLVGMDDTAEEVMTSLDISDSDKEMVKVLTIGLKVIFERGG